VVLRFHYSTPRACTKKAKARTNGEGRALGNRSVRRGTEGGTEEQTHGANWGASRYQPIQGRRAKPHQDEEDKPVEGSEGFG
jgi:hypothetical protein